MDIRKEMELMVQQISLQLEGNSTKWTNSLQGRSLVLSSMNMGQRIYNLYSRSLSRRLCLKGDLGLNKVVLI